MSNTKTCAGCKEVKDRSEFHDHVKYCKPCNIEEVKKVKQPKLDHKKMLVSSYKQICGCKICGYDRTAVALDFHHLDPKQKFKEVGVLMGQNYKWETVVEEIRKCVVLCSNCHRELHAGEVKLPE